MDQGHCLEERHKRLFPCRRYDRGIVNQIVKYMKFVVFFPGKFITKAIF